MNSPHQHIAPLEEQLHRLQSDYNALLHAVSHDLRAPLRHVLGFSELLSSHRDFGADEKSRKYLDIIVNSAERLNNMLEDLLAMSRLMRQPLHRTSIDLTELVSRAIGELKERHSTRSIKWRLEPLPNIEADPDLISTVISILLDNAIKFTRDRTESVIEIAATTRQADRPGFVVRDNGAGFDQKYADRLFGLFQRLYREDEFKGRGAGLAIARQIIRRHGGDIHVEANRKQGVAFTVSLPTGCLSDELSTAGPSSEDN